MNIRILGGLDEVEAIPHERFPSRAMSSGQSIFAKLRRLAIRAAKFEPEADCATWTVSEIRSDGISVVEKKRGAIKGPIRIPLHSQLFLFNALAFPCIPSKSLKFRLVVFSIPTAPANQQS